MSRSNAAEAPDTGLLGKVRVERYKMGRHWAVYDAEGLVAVTVYKKGAETVAERLTETERRPEGGEACHN